MEEGTKAVRAKLSVCALGFAFGLTWGLGVFLLGIASTYFNFGTPWVDLFASLYVGFASTLKGSFIGGIWGFVDAFVAGVVVALIYNIWLKCCPCPSCKKARN